MLCILFFVLAWSMICLYKIYQRFKFSDKFLLISIACVIISLISQIVALVIMVVDDIQMSKNI